MVKKNRKFILYGLLSIGLLLPLFAEGFLPDILGSTVKGLSEIYGPIIGLYLFSVIAFLAGGILLFISTSLLQWIFDITPEILTVSQGPIGQTIEVAWNFSAGIANMLLILAFVFIAITTILGIEKYQLQKLLPSLVIVAFLVNFTLLFVGMGIDIADVLFNSIAKSFPVEGENILFSAIVPMFEWVNQIVLASVVAIIGLAATMLFPFGEIAVFFAGIVGMFFLFSLIISNIINAFILTLLSFLFGLFFVILLFRVFIIQLLAILAPLAFLCLIFPDTKKYWEKWLETLVQWLLTGVVLIFFIYIGLAMVPLITRMGDAITQVDAPWGIEFFIQPLIAPLLLLVYFLTIFSLLRGLMPDLAKSGITAVKSAIPYAKSIGAGALKGGLYQTESAATQAANIAGKGKDKDIDKIAQEWSTSTPIKGQGLYKQVTSGIGSLAKRAASKPLISGLEADRKQVAEFKDRYKDASDAVKEKELADVKKLHNQNNRKAQNKLTALQSIGSDESALLENKEWYTQSRAKAKAKGQGDEFDRRHIISLVKHEGLDETKTGEKISSLVKSEDDAKQMTKTLADAMKSMDRNNREVGEKTYRALLKQKDTTPIKHITKNMKDGEGYQNIDIILRQEAAKEIAKKDKERNFQANPVTNEEMGRALKGINSNLHKELSRNPSLALTKAEIKTNQRPL